MIATEARRSLSRHVQNAKLLWRIRQHGSSKLNRVYEKIARSTDRGRMMRLEEEVRQMSVREPQSAAKYTDLRFWLLLNMRRAGYLELHRSAPLRILDIGCGPGYFVAVTRALGHEGFGVDVPEEYFTPTERKVYREVLSAIHCAQYTSPLAVERFTPLPFDAGNFDLITAFLICFNRHRSPDEWGVEEWRFFIDDARRCLRPGGKLWLELNEHQERYGDLVYYDEPTLAYFRSVGTVNNGRVQIQKD